MAAVTYYVALPFVWSEDGELVGEAQERQTSSAALRAAQALANTAAGDFSDAEIIKTFGTVPDVDTLLAAP